MKTLLVQEDGGHEAGARRALLERLASGLAVAAESDRYQWTCCWLPYGGPHGERWLWQRCGGQMPGSMPMTGSGRWLHCGHWHHQWEVFMA